MVRKLFNESNMGMWGKKGNLRHIDGKYYGFHGIYTKSLAEDHAKNLREKGKLVRVIKNKKYGAYDVYVRG